MNGFSTGDEDSRDSRASHGQVCCLKDEVGRCSRPAGNASYNKRIQKIVTQRKLMLFMDTEAQHIYICDQHKNMIQSARSRRRRRDSDEPDDEAEQPEIDLFNLQINTLRRYKRYFKLASRPGLNKAQLAEILMKHFRTLPVVEKDILTYFIYTVKTNRNRLHQKPSTSAEPS
ncbi:histone deacetylase complex subunit SAP30 homolog [Pollicipes pollicipes]|uniref:histone deacetylase complex subunit SAP30 homolog n=1 Tax=Pollicipes pollicipes TaxID=41117 RepID=UPI0018852F17|nr:histone deacetylase complex subunit SAP30 homolog [Pollicipes pollicipes]